MKKLANGKLHPLPAFLRFHPPYAFHLPLVLIKFDEYLPALNDIFINDPTYRNKSKYELVYQAGGFWNVTTRWICDGVKETPKEMAQIIGSIMPYLLKQ